MLTSQSFSALVFSFLALMSGGDSSDPLRYALCAERVASVEVMAPRARQPGWSVVVQLTPEASEEFAQVTGGNVGRMLEVVHGEEVFLRAAVRARIRSGTLLRPGYASQAEAEGVREAIGDVGSCPAG